MSTGLAISWLQSITLKEIIIVVTININCLVSYKHLHCCLKYTLRKKYSEDWNWAAVDFFRRDSALKIISLL